MTTKRLVGATALMLFGFAGCAQRTADSATVKPATAVSAQAVPQSGGALLWRVEGPNSPSYLFGTMHVGVHPDDDLPKYVWDTFATCSRLLVEMDLDDMAASKNEVMRLAILPDGESLDQKMTAEQWSQLLTLLDGALPEAALKRLRPWFVTFTVMQKFVKPTPSIDEEFVKRAKKNGVPVIPLEDWREATKLTAEAMKVDMLIDYIEDPEGSKKLYEQMTAAYIAGDADKLRKLVFDPSQWGDNPERAIDLLLYQRNNNWMAEIEKQVKQGGAMIAVGGGHLLGDRSVIAMLEERGFKVSRMRPPAK